MSATITFIDPHETFPPVGLDVLVWDGHCHWIAFWNPEHKSWQTIDGSLLNNVVSWAVLPTHKG